MRGILINPDDRTVMDVETDGELASLYRLLQCGQVEAVPLPNNHVLFVDEEGLYAHPAKRFFLLEGYEHNPFCGHGLILSTMGEDLDSAHVPVDFIYERLAWPDLEFMGMDIQRRNMDIGGRTVSAVVGQARFRQRGFGHG